MKKSTGFEQAPWGLSPVRNEGTLIGPDDPIPQQPVCERAKRGEPNCFLSSDMNIWDKPLVGSEYGPCKACYAHAPAFFDWAVPSK